MPEPTVLKGTENYTEPSQKELSDFRSWVIKSYPFGFVWGHKFSTLDNYRMTKEYQEWVQSNDYAKKYVAAQLVPGTEEKAARYLAGKQNAPSVTAGAAAGTGLGLKMPVRWGSKVENGYVFQVGYDEEGNEVSVDAIGRASGSEDELAAQKLAWEKERFGLEEGVNPYEQAEIDYRNASLAGEKERQGEMINWYKQEQQANLDSQRQERLATLRANPASWLEYASLAGETPAVQPWMQPLAPENYNTLKGAGIINASQLGNVSPEQMGRNAFETGKELPGWNPEGESLGGLPQLKTPSAQYMARMTPSAQEQFYGYEKARTGARPEDTKWRMWNSAPPSGVNASLRRMR